MNPEQSTLSERISSTKSGVLSNLHQGHDKKVLFVCSMGILRSATAARIYARKYNTRCAGTLLKALIPLTELLLHWADEIVWMNRENYNNACFLFDESIFDYKSKVLNIPDQYEHMHPALIKAIKKQYEPLRTLSSPVMRKHLILTKEQSRETIKRA